MNAPMALYLYGFVPEGAPSPPDELRGVDDAEVTILDLDGFGAAVSRVPGEDFDEEALERGLQDLEWVADQGARHERVVTWFVDRTDIVPAGLFSLHSSPEALESEADRRRERVLGELERLAGLREWDLKVSYDAGRLKDEIGALSEEIRTLDREIEDAGPGRRYLLERKRERRADEVVSDVARRQARELLRELAEEADAVDTRVVPPPRDADALPVVLNGALLVRRDREEVLRGTAERRARELEDRGIRVSFSGPWAPYRFVEDDDEE